MSTDLLTESVNPQSEGENLQTTQPPASTTDSSHFLSDLYRSDPSFVHFKSADDIAKSYKILNSLRGRSVLIPGKDAGKEDLDKFYTRLTSVDGVMRTPDSDNPEVMQQFYNGLGRPEESSGYEVDLGDDSGFINSTNLDSFKQIAHEAGLTNKQYESMVKFDVQRNRQQSQADMHAASSAVDLLQKRWGNEYNNRIAGAKAAFRTYQSQFPDGFQELERVAKNNPALVAMLSDIGKTMQEKGFIDAPHAYGGPTPEEALEKINEIRNNRQHAYHNVSDSGHEHAKKQMTSYYAIAYPD